MEVINVVSRHVLIIALFQIIHSNIDLDDFMFLNRSKMGKALGIDGVLHEMLEFLYGYCFYLNVL